MRNLMLALTLVLAALFAPPSAAASVSLAIQINPDFQSQPLAGSVLASARGAGFTDAAQALAGLQAGKFTLLPGNLEMGFIQDETWLAFDVKVSDPLADYLILQVGPAFLDQVTVYQTLPDGSLQSLGKAGDQVPREQVRVQARQPTFVIPVRGNSYSTVLVRLQTTSSMVAILHLYRPLAFQGQVATESLLLGGIFMLNIVMILVAAALYIFARQRLYLYWLSMVLVTTVLWFFIDGLAYRYLPLSDLGLINVATGLLNLLSVAVWILFSTMMFDFKSISLWLHRGCIGWAGFVVACIPLLAFFSNQQVQGVLLLSFAPILCVTCGVIVLQIARGNRDALLHGPLFMVYLGAASYNLSSLLGLTAISNASVYGWQVAGVLNFLSLQFSVYKRAYQTQRDYQADRAHLLGLLQQENLQLEAKVLARTQALEGALKEVEKAEQDQRQLLSMASHEFRTPAAIIKASLDSLAYLKQSIPPEVDQRLQNISKASQRLNQLANSLISHDRLKELSVQPKKVNTDLRQLVLNVLATYPSDSALQAQLPDHPVSVQLDPLLITIALHNLIDNALRHSEAGATAVTVSLLTSPDAVALQVADLGPGIADADKENVFERFFSSRSSPSAGLGLSIVQTIARSHGGQAVATDNTPQGTVMVISLPLAVT